MTTQVADAKPADPPAVHDAASCSFIEIDPVLEDERSRPARGITVAVLISTPLWALIAFLLYILL